MRQPRTQVLRSDAKAVSTRVAEGNLATDDGRARRGPRTKGPREAGTGRGQRAAGPTGKRDERRAAGDKASTHACCRDARRGASVADRRRGATYRQGRGGSSGGELLGGGGEEKRRGACGGASEPRRGTAIARRGRAAPDRAVAAKTLSARGRKETASLNAVPQCAQRKRRVGQRGEAVFACVVLRWFWEAAPRDEDDSAHGEGDRPHGKYWTAGERTLGTVFGNCRGQGGGA
ncbi:hypothetical protein ERJ75_000617100 [Trypanosoma vivax]|nr:hypothetical protein ERJ75_000617100 [Trypanosoma vivax]